jgi:hypothetical protein
MGMVFVWVTTMQAYDLQLVSSKESPDVRFHDHDCPQ